MADSTQKSYYQYFAQGIEVSISGRLGAEPEIKTLDNGNRVMKLSIAYPAGSKKKDDGTYENLSEWASLSIWESANGAKELFAAVANTESKLKFGKGHSVEFKGRVVIKSTVSGERAFINYDVKDVYHLYKVYTAPKNDDNGSTTSHSNSNNNSSAEGLPGTSNKDQF